jgi:hypothetical protein
MKSGGLPASPTNTNALPGSDKLVPKTTIPKKRDWASAHPGTARTRVKQLTATHRMKDADVRSVLFMT